MDLSMNGKKIDVVYLPDTNDECGRQLVAGHPGCESLHLSATYHGDHEEFWIVQMYKGEEVARHNPRYVETIAWAKE